MLQHTTIIYAKDVVNSITEIIRDKSAQPSNNGTFLEISKV